MPFHIAGTPDLNHEHVLIFFSNTSPSLWYILLVKTIFCSTQPREFTYIYTSTFGFLPVYHRPSIVIRGRLRHYLSSTFLVTLRVVEELTFVEPVLPASAPSFLSQSAHYPHSRLPPNTAVSLPLMLGRLSSPRITPSGPLLPWRIEHSRHSHDERSF